VLLRLWQAHVEWLESFAHHHHAGYRAVNVDITAFYRPQLKSCLSKHYYAPAGKALPAIIMGLVGVTGSLQGQRLAVPREILRVVPEDPCERSATQLTAYKSPCSNGSAASLLPMKLPS
jgi:hypothetical protein